MADASAVDFEPECSHVRGVVPADDNPIPDGDDPIPDGDPASVVLPPHIEQTFPMGGKIQMGESMTPDGPTVYISLASPNCEPSLILWIDAISRQPMITLRGRKDSDPDQYEYRSYPMDKIMRSPHAGRPGHPFV